VDVVVVDVFGVVGSVNIVCVLGVVIVSQLVTGRASGPPA